MKGLESLQSWLTDRYPLKALFTGIRRHVSKPVPPHTNILFTLGSLALLLFLREGRHLLHPHLLQVHRIRLRWRKTAYT